MARVVPGTEVNLPAVAEVRISTAKRWPGRILAVRDPLWGWMNYPSYGLILKLEGIVKDIGPMELVAWGGLTFMYAGTIKNAETLANWIKGVAGEVGGAFSDVFGAINAGLAALFAPGVDPEHAQALLGEIQPDLGAIGALLHGLIGPLGTLNRYVYAAVAASLTILAFP